MLFVFVAIRFFFLFNYEFKVQCVVKDRSRELSGDASRTSVSMKKKDGIIVFSYSFSVGTSVLWIKKNHGSMSNSNIAGISPGDKSKPSEIYLP